MCYIGLPPPPSDMKPALLPAILFAAAFGTACTGDHEPRTAVTENSDGPVSLFAKVPTAHSGIKFRNAITEDLAINYLTYNNLYSGSGVGVGDVNNDGLPDLYFTGNQVQDKLYINKGGLVFEDVTDKAIKTGRDGWHRGVSMVDIDQDGWLDIYVCRSGWQADPALRANLLYMNDRDGTFTERALEFGLADTSHSTQALFFDSDRDGDLDCYILNHPGERTPTQGEQSVEEVRELVAKGKSETDRLMRNDGPGPDGSLRFTDITRQAGITNHAYGLGICMLDVDNNGWPDVYVANDYAEPDYLYVNNGKGGFTNQVKERTKHVSNFGMGVDVGDIDNDGMQDICVLDMAFKSHQRSKQNMGAMRPAKFWAYVDAGLHYQYMFNTLQRNNGNGSFSEIALMAGMAKTDWSWSALFEDLDNDGWQDLYASNGIKRDVRNNDAQNALMELHRNTSGNTTLEAVLGLMPITLVPDVCFRNNGDLTFTDVTTAWGLEEPNVVHGMVVSDLDRDGDLDIVLGREEAEVSLFENMAQTVLPSASWIDIALDGPPMNKAGIGATVSVRCDGTERTRIMQVVRGYQSSQEARLHFGLGESKGPVEVEVRWPDGRVTTTTVPVNQSSALAWMSDAPEAKEASALEPLFALVGGLGTGRNVHSESSFNDFATEILLPQRYSRLGPFLSAGEMNGDGRDDIFVSGPSGQPSRLYLQQPDGNFLLAPGNALAATKEAEDLGSCMFDADGDGDNDVLVVAGGNEHKTGSDLLKPRLYINNGKGLLALAAERLPDIRVSAQRPAVGDMDGDGDLDIFIGGRVVPGQYPIAPSSYLLRNDGGVFTDVTFQNAPELMQPGMITDAHFADMDGDNDNDLVLVGEWMPVSVYLNDKGSFTNRTKALALDSTAGWWYSLAVDDLDGDGDNDLVAGNLGLNAKFHARHDDPFRVFCNDFDGNGTYDIVLATEQQGKLLPVRGRECSSEQMPSIKDRFPTYKEFSEADINSICTPQGIADAYKREAREFRSGVFLNEGGKFHFKPLHNLAQIAPVNDILVMDTDGDGHKDIVLAGNNHDTEVETIRYDAGTGLILLSDGKGGYTPLSIPRSGFFADGNVKDLQLVTVNGLQHIVVANNGGVPMWFKPSQGRRLAAR